MNNLNTNSIGAPTIELTLKLKKMIQKRRYIKQLIANDNKILIFIR